MEKQIKKELEEMGILSAEELDGGEGGGVNGGDEVLAELERCQAELKVSDQIMQTQKQIVKPRNLRDKTIN